MLGLENFWLCSRLIGLGNPTTSPLRCCFHLSFRWIACTFFAVWGCILRNHLIKPAKRTTTPNSFFYWINTWQQGVMRSDEIWTRLCPRQSKGEHTLEPPHVLIVCTPRNEPSRETFRDPICISERRGERESRRGTRGLSGGSASIVRPKVIATWAVANVSTYESPTARNPITSSWPFLLCIILKLNANLNKLAEFTRGEDELR